MSLNGSYCSYSTNSWIEPEEASRLPFGEVVASCQFHDISKEKSMALRYFWPSDFLSRVIIAYRTKKAQGTNKAKAESDIKL
jgi:hypothetical protein